MMLHLVQIAGTDRIFKWLFQLEHHVFLANKSAIALVHDSSAGSIPLPIRQLLLPAMK